MARKTDKLAVAEFPLIDETLLKSRIYTIRGVKVMIDADLAEIYGYEKKVFNQQVKNNIEKFDEDFRFQLTKAEMENISGSKNLTLEPHFSAKTNDFEQKDNLKSKFLTSSWGGLRKSPFAFTEQGIYMLMTVLKGERATAQSKALIRLFKQMKDYIIAENRNLLGYDGIAQIAVQTERNTKDIAVIQSDLQKVMENFVDPSTYKHFLILKGQKLEADVAYAQIYGMAKKSLLIVDNYVDIKTLNLLRNARKGVSILIASDQCARITDDMLNDFRAAMPSVSIDTISAAHKFHDRYILVDFRTNSEKLFHCGASSKDAGNKITTIVQLDDIDAYREMFEELYDRYRMLRTMQQLSVDAEKAGSAGMTLDEINAEIAAVRSGK